ncbi:Protein of unknown function [Pyronema omphalodes CBS 100304]|uniref:Uncharacterized protein n=1 Tax=Pyronema omphalodes (strain CBS 100304) TaxID=1076935 RepID=U4LFB3_PYROM|nr:Protein of unknown function [Pyronema omphalodes CBS 100304]
MSRKYLSMRLRFWAPLLRSVRRKYKICTKRLATSRQRKRSRLSA